MNSAGAFVRHGMDRSSFLKFYVVSMAMNSVVPVFVLGWIDLHSLSFRGIYGNE